MAVAERKESRASESFNKITTFSQRSSFNDHNHIFLKVQIYYKRIIYYIASYSMVLIWEMRGNFAFSVFERGLNKKN